MNSDRVGRIASIWEFSKIKISFPGHDRTQIKKSHCFCSKNVTHYVILKENFGSLGLHLSLKTEI